MKKNLSLLILIFTSIFHIVSCRVDEDSLSRNKNFAENTLLDSDRKQNKKSQDLTSDSAKNQEIKESNKNFRTSKSNGGYEAAKKKTKKLFPGISPISD